MMTDDDRHHPEKQQVSYHVLAADLVGDGRVDLYAGFRILAAVPHGLPLLLLDVDGVLNPFAADQCPSGYEEFDFFPDEEPVRLCRAHADWLRELGDRFEMAWATGWGAEANRLLAPVLQLPQLPVIGFPPVPFEPREKVPAIARYVGSRPAVWIDDALTPEARAWAKAREVPTLLVDVDPAEGLTQAVVRRSLGWAEDLLGSERSR